MNKTRSIITVCDMIKANAHLKSGLSAIDETESIFERSCSVRICAVDQANEDEREGLFPDNEDDNNGLNS